MAGGSRVGFQALGLLQVNPEAHDSTGFHSFAGLGFRVGFALRKCGSKSLNPEQF